MEIYGGRKMVDWDALKFYAKWTLILLAAIGLSVSLVTYFFSPLILSYEPLPLWPLDDDTYQVASPLAVAAWSSTLLGILITALVSWRIYKHKQPWLQVLKESVDRTCQALDDLKWAIADKKIEVRTVDAKQVIREELMPFLMKVDVKSED